jgi:glucuronokinase
MKVRTTAPSRAGLAGNPSDGYGGRALALAIPDLEAWAVIEPHGAICIGSERDGELALDWQFITAVGVPVGPHRLALAACRRFVAGAIEAGLLDGMWAWDHGFRLRYGSEIPEKVGLAGSSAITVAILRALSGHYDVVIPERDLPTLALSVEADELGIHGGLMDPVAQVMGGLVYMDLSEDLIHRTGGGRYERLPSECLPPLFVAWSEELAAGSDVVHNELRDRFVAGDAEVVAVMVELAGLAEEARTMLLEGRAEDLPRLMDENFELRARIVDVGGGNRRLVETGRRLGAGVKQTGSGGAVIGAFDGDPGRLAALRTSYEAIGARFLVPGAGKEPRDGSIDV